MLTIAAKLCSVTPRTIGELRRKLKRGLFSHQLVPVQRNLDDAAGAPPLPRGLKLSARIADVNTKLMAGSFIDSTMSLPGLERIVFGEAKDQLGLTPPQRVAALEDTIKDWI